MIQLQNSQLALKKSLNHSQKNLPYIMTDMLKCHLTLKYVINLNLSSFKKTTMGIGLIFWLNSNMQKNYFIQKKCS